MLTLAFSTGRERLNDLLGDAFLLLGVSARLGSIILAWDEYARCWDVSRLCSSYIRTCFTKRGDNSEWPASKQDIHLSGEGDLQVSLCSVYSFSRFIQSSVAGISCVPFCYLHVVLQKVYDLQLIEVLIVQGFRSMLEFQVTGDGTWFLHACFAG